MPDKLCSKCKVTKSLGEFSVDKTKKDGYTYQCKECRMGNYRRWAKANPDKEAEGSRRFREKNPESAKRTFDLHYVAHYAKYLDRNQRRRAIKVEATVGPVSRIRVFERDGWVCGICHVRVDSSVVWPAPGSAVLDHIVPLAKGGEHSMGNVQLAHAKCNNIKSDRMPA